MGGVVFAAPCPEYHPLEYPGELLWIPRKERQPIYFGIPCILLQHEAAPRLVVIFHANAEDLGRSYGLLRYLRAQLRLHILVVEYPGYGICSGAPSEQTLLEDAEVVMQFVQHQLEVPLDKIVLMGRSLGGAPAVYLAGKYECASLIAVATFTSLRAIVGSYVGWGSWFFDTFDNLHRIRTVTSPTLIIHGVKDAVVNVSQAKELADSCGEDADIRPIVVLSIRDGVHHNDFDIEDDVVAPIKETFPALLEGDELCLDSADFWLQQRTRQLAADVYARVPYHPDCIPYGATVPKREMTTWSCDAPALSAAS